MKNKSNLVVGEIYLVKNHIGDEYHKKTYLGVNDDGGVDFAFHTSEPKGIEVLFNRGEGFMVNSKGIVVNSGEYRFCPKPKTKEGEFVGQAERYKKLESMLQRREK